MVRRNNIPFVAKDQSLKEVIKKMRGQRLELGAK